MTNPTNTKGSINAASTDPSTAIEIDPTNLSDQIEPETIEPDQADPSDPGDQVEAETDSTKPESANREAAKYRVALREAEGERDSALALVELLQRATVLSLAAELSQPEDLLQFSEDGIAGMLGEDGQVDQAKVRTSVAALLESRPGLRKPKWGQVHLGPQGEGFAPPRNDLASLISGKVAR
jgi:hypothetical protein